ncbi:Clathrin coat assembly protein AP180 [Raphanus sativus]|uniref:Clathrin coat assembly protein AP180-like n=1 Tax=Raphanus sativus TaxID=3726 RepID=A0A6J0KMB4_RAPSA|nr:clathrin coat assembly protein AP180-like [Raphanus sativus]KAJ4878857.1 Clathrin coat assembly protein AP180 [Raphanus sativus]
MPSKLKKAIGAVKDQTSISLAKVTNRANRGGDLTTLEVAILKATSHDEDVPIDDRLVSDILAIISSKKSHAAACAAAIGRRIGRTRNWIVALKSLVLVLRIFQDGDPYFPREVLHVMKRGAKILNLSTFRDDSNSRPWDYSAYVRTFALYLDERLDCFLTGKLQRRYTNNKTGIRSRFNPKTRNKTDEPAVRDMKPAMLLDKITYWQRLLDRAIATRPTGDAKANRLVKTSLYAVLQESFDLYRDISDGLALLLDSFFHLPYKSCVHAFQASVRASKQFEELNKFYDLCKSNGVGRTSEYPSVQKISLELLETLQEFLKDQSSFPGNNAGMYPSPNSLLLPPPPSSTVSSSLSERCCSDYGSFRSASLEDTGTSSPPMSCHSEPYGGGREDPNGNSFDTVSTKSLPNTPSVSSASSIDDKEKKKKKKEKTKKQEEAKVEGFDPWEALMLRDEPRKNIETIPEEASTSEVQRGSGNWLLALEETVTTQVHDDDTNSMAIVPFGLDDPMPVAFQATATDQYNPFLVESAAPLAKVGPTVELMSTTFNALAVTDFQVNVPDDFEPSTAPTFKATGSLPDKCEPFATFESFGFEESVLENGGVHEQSVLQEQQLWLQNQNKIIAKHLNLI